ncbi:MAG: hypothetical protein B7Y95_09140 [Rhizobiales bacterium 32-66-11]|nr:MAG: hypothetical protein B7Y95_09140 [Rhizobiales bacterium 32-66-11]
MTARFVFRCVAALLALLGGTGLAMAHPHVWVTMKTQVVYAPDGTITGLKQDWTFDDAFTAFALQGLERNKDGSYPDSVLKPLAEVNVTSLKEYDYFVRAKTATAKLVFKDPVDYYLTYENEALTLHFFLPLVKPIPAKGSMSFDIYDPTYFVSFEFAEKDPVSLSGAPKGCTFQTVQPEQPQNMQLGEEFFTNLTSSSTYGAQYADKVAVKCP